MRDGVRESSVHASCESATIDWRGPAMGREALEGLNERERHASNEAEWAKTRLDGAHAAAIAADPAIAALIARYEQMRKLEQGR
jgi:hypothetical protein